MRHVFHWTKWRGWFELLVYESGNKSALRFDRKSFVFELKRTQSFIFLRASTKNPVVSSFARYSPSIRAWISLYSSSRQAFRASARYSSTIVPSVAKFVARPLTSDTICSTISRNPHLFAKIAHVFADRGATRSGNRYPMESLFFFASYMGRCTRRTLENEEVLAALGFPLEAEQVLQNPPAMLATTAPGCLVPAALRIQLDLCQNADQELVHVMGQTRRGLDKLATATVRQTPANCRQERWARMSYKRDH